MPAHRLLVIVGALGVGACSSPSTSPSSAPTPTAQSSAMPQTDGIVRQLQGQVRQRLDAGYLYLEIEDAQGTRHWVVSLMKDVAVGADVDASVFGSRQGFWSKRLQRRFDTLGFAVVRLR